MRILVLETAARDQHVRLDQRLDYRFVCITLLALVIDDTLAGKARRGIGESTVFIDGVGNGRVDAARFQGGAVRRPDFEVLAPMSRRGMHKAGAGVVGN